MKKTYSNPTIQVVKIQIQQILAGSPDSAYDTTGNGTQLSRKDRFGFDDEDEEEEY